MGLYVRVHCCDLPLGAVGCLRLECMGWILCSVWRTLTAMTPGYQRHRLVATSSSGLPTAPRTLHGSNLRRRSSSAVAASETRSARLGSGRARTAAPNAALAPGQGSQTGARLLSLCCHAKYRIKLIDIWVQTDRLIKPPVDCPLAAKPSCGGEGRSPPAKMAFVGIPEANIQSKTLV